MPAVFYLKEREQKGAVGGKERKRKVAVGGRELGRTAGRQGRSSGKFITTSGSYWKWG